MFTFGITLAKTETQLKNKEQFNMGGGGWAGFCPQHKNKPNQNKATTKSPNNLEPHASNETWAET